MPRIGMGEWIAAGGAIARGHLSRYGKQARYTNCFEKRLAQATGATHALAVSSGTAALISALAAAQIGPGDEVLVPAYTWMATATAVVMVGAVPVFVDIDETLTIDPGDIEAKITPYTRAIMPVHMGNAPCDMDAIMGIASRHGLLVIEDACQAVGVRYKDRHLGTIGHLGAYSFNKMKNMNIGEGGAVLTSDERYFVRARGYHDLGDLIRDHEGGLSEPSIIGVNYKVTEIQTAMAAVQLRKLGPMLERMRRRRAMMAEILSGSSEFRVTPHNDADNAVSLTILAPTKEAAVQLQGRRGVWNRLRDSSKHVYTNWEPILAQRTSHPKFNPWAWANREIRYDKDMCLRTLDILDRTCVVNLGMTYPSAVMRRVARGIAR
ncbi:DegT/DnrJ/EryC1/StrS family aminotransferase [Aureimonas frigidaquae]|uniref:DegT/DnrJ/EryC1/StrS family aminotransferase n=1 Tax=Aureimonas frigidaquae TaxID=424757 RepID=UPI0007815408|nr:aminotransferase class I/II-fold pyridoxal phosphate-dependent enzyme [Aureimonas frigidaquae]